MYYRILLFLDVSELLFAKTYKFDYIQAIDSTVTSICLPDWTCNDANYAVFNFSRFTQIESIEIGNDSFCSVKTFNINGLNKLKSLKIGKNSFTQNKNKHDCDYSKSFNISNCESLESIQISAYSFSDFAGSFGLKQLPNLQSIQIGNEDSDSWNFRYCSFTIMSNESF